MKKDTALNAQIINLCVVQYRDQEVQIEGTLVKSSRRLQRSQNITNSHFKAILNSFLLRAMPNTCVEFRANGKTMVHGETNKHGSFKCAMNIADLHQLDFRIGHSELWEEVVLEEVYFDYRSVKMLIISDIDDTILETHVSNGIKKLRTLLGVRVAKRKEIEKTQVIMNRLTDNGGAIVYVSRSETNLWFFLREFMAINTLPTGRLVLYPLRKARTLMREKEASFKYGAIQQIVGAFQGDHVVCIGDDSQQDMAIYSQIAKEYPEKVQEVYVHQVGRHPKTEVAFGLLRLAQSGIKTMYY